MYLKSCRDLKKNLEKGICKIHLTSVTDRLVFDAGNSLGNVKLAEVGQLCGIFYLR